MARHKASRVGEPVCSKGMAIPFTFWPENYIKNGSFVASNCWQFLINYIDSMKGDKTKQLRARAYTEQSFQLFLSSKEASVQAKPLMLYYSYLNLAKAFLAFRRGPSNGGEIHGLKLDTPPSRYRGLKSIKFRVVSPRTRGTSSIFHNLMTEINFSPLEEDKPIELSNMIEQIVGLHDYLVATSNIPRVFFPVKLSFMRNKERKTVWIRGEIEKAGCTKAHIKTIIGFFERSSSLCCVYDKETKGKIVFESAEEANYISSPIRPLREKLIVPIRRNIFSEQTPNGFQYYLCCRDDFTGQIISHFAVMFVLGSLVRYYPEVFAKMQKEWLVHEYLTTQPIQYAYLLGSGMIRNEIVPLQVHG